MARSAGAETVTSALAELFAELASPVVEETLAVVVMVEASEAALEMVRFTTKVAVPALARLEPSVQVTVPVEPTVGLEQVHPLGGVVDAKVVFAGVVNVNTGAVAVAGPLLVTTAV
jgi:hypothetical protein